MNLSKALGKALLPGVNITVTVYTVGGTDTNGNEVDEPIVFQGYYKDAVEFFGNEENLSNIQNIYDNMPDGYITIETDDWCREAYDAYEIMQIIEEMI